MIICAITQKEAVEPVVSTKTGHVYEKRIIRKALEGNGGKCPITGEDMDMDNDLIDIKMTGVQQDVKENMSDEDHITMNARSVASTSIPGMLQLFQNEWDTLMLEQFTLKQHLDKVRTELAQALYQHDAACRVIARLMKEKEQLKGSVVENGNQMTDDSQASGLTNEIIQNMTNVSTNLYSMRKKRRISPSLKSVDEIAKMQHTSKHLLHGSAKVTAVAVRNDKTAPLALTGGSDGKMTLFNLKQEVVAATLTGHRKPITALAFHKDMDIVYSASQDSTARIWTANKNGEYNSYFTLRHKAPVTGLSIQATGDYIVTSCLDASWNFFDVASGVKLVSASASDGLTSTQFHPDGLILGTGTTAGQLLLWDVKTQSNFAQLNAHNGDCQSISFSENGYLVATCGADQVVKVYDLRALKKNDGSECIETFTKPGPVNQVRFDESGMYLAVGSGSQVDIYQSKQWNLLTTLEGAEGVVTDFEWGDDAHALAVTSEDRHLHLFHVN